MFNLTPRELKPIGAIIGTIFLETKLSKNSLFIFLLYLLATIMPASIPDRPTAFIPFLDSLKMVWD